MAELEPPARPPVAAPAVVAAPLPPSSDGPGPNASNVLTGWAILSYLLVLAGLTVAVLLVCSFVGPASLSDEGVWGLRLRRGIKAALVGAALASSGMALQGILRNPLAEPYILGVSSGAGVGVMLSMLVTYLANLATYGSVAFASRAQSWLSLPAFALAGALLTCAAVYFIAQRRGRLDPYVLLLSGVIVNAFNGAIMLALYLTVPPNDIANFATWSMGYITESIHWPTFIFSAAAVLVGWIGLMIRGASFNMLGLGDEVAGSSGVHVHYLRVETFVLVSLMTAAAVAISGPIGFVGLIVPHICRTLVGPDHRRLALVCGFAGAMFVMVGDTVCNVLGPVLHLGSLPVGILMALSGGPFFIYLLRKRRSKVEA